MNWSQWSAVTCLQKAEQWHEVNGLKCAKIRQWTVWQEQSEMCIFTETHAFCPKCFTKSDLLEYFVSADPVDSLSLPTFRRLSDFAFGHLHDKVNRSFIWRFPCLLGNVPKAPNAPASNLIWKQPSSLSSSSPASSSSFSSSSPLPPTLSFCWLLS